jgi:hypothetical protein
MSEKEDDWCKPFIDFILDQLVLENKAERERITRRSGNYVVIGTDLVGDSHKGPLNNQGKPTYFHKKQNANKPKTRVR